MQIQIFTIPILNNDQEIENLNLFLRQNRIVEIKKDIVCSNALNYWTFCITYIPSQLKIIDEKKKSNRIDYRNELDEHTFSIFCELRKLRKQIADEEIIPPFAIFTDAELAEISKIENPQLSALKKIEGIGDRKIEKYGFRFCETLNNLIITNNEKIGESD